MGDVSTRNPIVWFFVICFIGSMLVLGWLLFPFLPILVLGAVISGISHPLFSAIQRFLNVRSALAAFLTCFLIFMILFVPTVFFVSSLAQQAFGLYQMAKDAVFNQQITSFLRDTRVLDRANDVLAHFHYSLSGDEIKNGVSEIVKFVGLYLYNQATAIASNTLAFVVNFFLMMMVIFFLLLDGHRLVSYIIDLSPLPTDQEQKLINRFKEMTGAILIVNGLSGMIQGGLGGLVFWIFGFNSAFLWGVIMGLLAFLPIIGIGAVVVPTAIYLFYKGRIAASIFFVVFYIIVAGGTEYIFKPKIVGQQANIHPLLIFFAIIGGLKLFGILGIIYGPLVVTMFLTLADIYRANYQRLVESQER
jgi:predicted PurR-regulated permease PerM